MPCNIPEWAVIKPGDLVKQALFTAGQLTCVADSQYGHGGISNVQSSSLGGYVILQLLNRIEGIPPCSSCATKQARIEELEDVIQHIQRRFNELRSLRGETDFDREMALIISDAALDAEKEK